MCHYCNNDGFILRMCFENCKRVLFETSYIDNYFGMITSWSVSLAEYTIGLILVDKFVFFFQFISLFIYQSHNFVCIFKKV